ncbi:related to allantoate permease [Sporisorium reilianum SRZ2]|uniref:Related to allantoate permease n=1 Tax=Sporisorium reilianum (strain SRZ2) TaxID=999809 RepID=E7A0U3_SPORE|nr:related to allantoate permease [Sporisorium reilianum SRZ2]
MSSPISEAHSPTRYDDKSQPKGGDGTVVSTMSRGYAADSIDGEGFPADIDEKKLMRKVDMRLIPWLSFLYLLSFLDRSAIGNARLYGLEKELKLTSTQYGLALTVFFFPYALFEVPSNVLLKRLRPSIWFPLITTLVGICMLSQGLVRNYHGLLVARFFLGVTEAGLFPGAQVLMFGWYKRSEFGLRSSIFFSAATISGAFGGLLAFALNKMDGVGGYSGWRWIFIIIALVTFLAGVASYWLCVDFPDTASFLSDAERRAVIYRLQQDQQFSAAGEGLKWANVWKAFLDWKTWVGLTAYAGCDGPLYAFSLFTPTITKAVNVRWSANEANLASIPIYVVACLVTIAVGFMADRTSRRSLYSVVLSIIGVVGYAILISNDPKRRPGVSYFAIYLAALGIYPMIPNTISIVANNSEGAYVRSVVLGLVISFGNINGAVSSNIYPRNTSPRFIMGHAIVLGYIVIGIISNIVFFFGLQYENRQREAGRRNETILADDPAMLASGKDLQAEAARIRAQEIKDAGRIGGLFRRLHVGGGGTYATWEEAKMLKGDQVSTFRYRT